MCTSGSCEGEFAMLLHLTVYRAASAFSHSVAANQGPNGGSLLQLPDCLLQIPDLQSPSACARALHAKVTTQYYLTFLLAHCAAPASCPAAADQGPDRSTLLQLPDRLLQFPDLPSPSACARTLHAHSVVVHRAASVLSGPAAADQGPNGALCCSSLTSCCRF